jgi:hypothetical protein
VSEARTAKLVQELANGVEADLGEITADLDAVRAKIEALADAAKAINGLAVSCNGWADRLQTMAGEIKKEQQEIPAKLLGRSLPKVEVHTRARDAA